VSLLDDLGENFASVLADVSAYLLEFLPDSWLNINFDFQIFTP
jgi:hypothetical protein